MFTGIVTATGTVISVDDRGDRVLRVGCIWPCNEIAIGASIAHSGICLTVISRDAHSFKVAASAETVNVTTLGQWREGDVINLERALCLGDELGGHMVSGHVDGLATLNDIKIDKDSWILNFSVSPDLSKYLTNKCSITIDGISLTVNNVNGESFEISIVPFTWENTNLKFSSVGEKFNLEIDMIARYVFKALKK